MFMQNANLYRLAFLFVEQNVLVFCLLTGGSRRVGMLKGLDDLSAPSSLINSSSEMPSKSLRLSKPISGTLVQVVANDNSDTLIRHGSAFFFEEGPRLLGDFQICILLTGKVLEKAWVTLLSAWLCVATTDDF
jgi:hypothetical protein